MSGQNFRCRKFSSHTFKIAFWAKPAPFLTPFRRSGRTSGVGYREPPAGVHQIGEREQGEQLRRCSSPGRGSAFCADTHLAETFSRRRKTLYLEYFSASDQMDEFVPQNELESKLLAARQGLIPIGDFVRQLWASELMLPTASEVQADGAGFEPVLFDKQGARMLAAFTSRQRVARVGQIAKFCLITKGAHVLRRMPEGYGLVINPGLKAGLEISPQGISEILAEFG
jgi:hypothetical protein